VCWQTCDLTSWINIPEMFEQPFQDFLASQNCSHDSEVLEMSNCVAWCFDGFFGRLGRISPPTIHLL